MFLMHRGSIVAGLMSAVCLLSGSEVALANTSVSLSAAANVMGVAKTGTAVADGGLDGLGYAYSSSLLGGTATWAGINFTLGQAGALDASSNTTLSLPAGNYATLSLLATGVDGNQPSQSFVVTYTDGTSSTFVQSLSDWHTPQSYAGESKALSEAYRLTSTGAMQTGPFYVYGYSFAISSAKTVKSVKLPSNRHVVVLAMSLAPQPTSVSLTASATVEGVAKTGAAVANGGLDGLGNAYSSSLLGTTATWAGMVFSLGQASALDASSNTTLSLPAGNFAALSMLATGVDGNQPSQTFIVTYTDGTSTSFVQSLSDWHTPQSYAGESKALSEAYRLTSTGTMQTGPYYVYGYTFALNSAKTVKSLKLPSTRHVVVLSISLTPSGATAVSAIPAVPAGVAAAPGNAQVALSWTTSSGATSYHVKRATTGGGPYTQIGATTAASYADKSLSNGTIYYYVVSALDSAGESANSTGVRALPVASVSTPALTTYGTWINVTPTGVDLSDALSCGNYGTESVQVDPANPANLYTEFNCQGIWKSSDYGATWTGPINTGSNGAAVTDCAGGITIAPGTTASVPTLYEACIRGSGTGFWKSIDGGVNWTKYSVAPSGASRQDYYPPVVDPYDANHLLMAGHEMDYLVESIDGGKTWTNVSLNGGMLENGGTGAIFFINTNNASSTRGTWLWMAQQNGGTYGTWRTTNSGAAWRQVDKNEHPHGASQIYQPDNNGVLYMAGAYSAHGWGVLRSSDYGQTWTHVGGTSNETVVFGTAKNVYSMYGYPIGIGGVNNPSFEIASQPGTGAWATPGTPAGSSQGAGQIQVVDGGTHNIFVGAMWNSGLWRYVEP